MGMKPLAASNVNSTTPWRAGGNSTSCGVSAASVRIRSQPRVRSVTWLSSTPLRSRRTTGLVAPGADEEDARHGAMLDGAGRATDYHPRVSLTGKRVLITGGAGFIGTTLARRLVDANEVLAVDNLHRNALAGTELEAHPGATQMA